MPVTNPSPHMKNDYIHSERFIHDQLIERCNMLVEVAKKIWRDKKGDPSIVIAWPSEPVKGADGEMIEDEILAEYGPVTRADWQAHPELRQERLRRLVDMTKAYGLLVIELQPHALVAIFESPHGAKSWTTRLELHGDVKVMAKTEERSNKEHYGLIWSPSQGTA